jgi:hypothetical protein
LLRGNEAVGALDRTKAIKFYTEYLQRYSSEGQSDIVLDLFIPVIERDLEMLPLAIESFRENIRHPLGEIFILAPGKLRKRVAERVDSITFVDGHEVLPITTADIDYQVRGIDRAGWIFQQLLKLNADMLTTQNYLLVLDADTVLIRPHCFIDRQRCLLHFSDEYHQPYFPTYQKLTGLSKRYPLSFVCQYMLFNRERLAELKQEIQNTTGMEWYRAIIAVLDQEEMSSFSEFETYGNYMVYRHRREVFMEHALNMPASRRDIQRIMANRPQLAKRFKSIAFHHYLG